MEQTAKLHALAQKYEINILTYEGDTIYTEDDQEPYGRIEKRLLKCQWLKYRTFQRRFPHL